MVESAVQFTVEIRRVFLNSRRALLAVESVYDKQEASCKARYCLNVATITAMSAFNMQIGTCNLTKKF
ncbi:unnamed protein product [Calypogeia fissa]